VTNVSGGYPTVTGAAIRGQIAPVPLSGTEIDPALAVDARARIPSLQHGRRFEVTAPADKSRLHLVGKAL